METARIILQFQFHFIYYPAGLSPGFAKNKAFLEVKKHCKTMRFERSKNIAKQSFFRGPNIEKQLFVDENHFRGVYPEQNFPLNPMVPFKFAESLFFPTMFGPNFSPDQP